MSVAITGVDVVGKRIPLAGEFPVSYETTPDTEHVFVRLRTDGDVVGYGEGTALPWFTGESTEAMAATIDRWFAPRIEGTPVKEAMAEFTQFRERFPGNPGAKAAMELALLDVRGKVAGLPVHELLGTRAHDTVPVVYTIPGLEPSEAASLVHEQSEAGFTRFKVKATGELETDVARIDAVLDALPAGATVRIDANTGWGDHPTALEAIERIQVTEKVEYLEQPVSPDRVEDLRSLWYAAGIPVYADEAVHDVADVEEIGRKQLAAGCHLKLAKAGSLIEEEHMARVAHRHGIEVTVVSAFGTSLDVAANLHLASVVPNLSAGCELGAIYLERDPTTNELGRAPEMTVPTGSGLGVGLEDDIFEG